MHILAGMARRVQVYLLRHLPTLQYRELRQHRESHSFAREAAVQVIRLVPEERIPWCVDCDAQLNCVDVSFVDLYHPDLNSIVAAGSFRQVLRMHHHRMHSSYSLICVINFSLCVIFR